jgi:hypothetical protein
MTRTGFYSGAFDPVTLGHTDVIRRAGHIMHRYNANMGFAQFSIASAAKALGFDERTLKRARKLLRELDWIRPYEKSDKRGPGSWLANKYILSGGPEDLLFDEADQSDGGDT